YGSEAEGLGGACVSDFDLGAGDGAPGHFCFSQLAAGSGYSCGVDGQGRVVCWGLNTSGQLGNGATAAAGSDQASPDEGAPVVKLGGTPLEGVIGLSVGTSHACAVLGDGTAWCWGVNSYGQLGDGNTTSVAYAAQVKAPTKFVQLAAGASHTCGV